MCTFGVLANKWCVLHTLIQVEPDFVDEIIKLCCVLHNSFRRRDGFNNEDTETNILDDIEVSDTGARTQDTEVRDYFAKYFMGPELVQFQFQKI